MATIKVVIDTNNLPRKFSPPSAAYKRIVTLVQEGVVDVLIPYVVIEEWRTQRNGELKTEFQKLKKSMRDILVFGAFGDEKGVQLLEKSAETIARWESESEKIAKDALGEMLNSLGATVLPVTGDHALKVVDAYFSGGPAFSKPKMRDDFPDSFIYSAIADARQTNKRSSFFVVTQDRNLKTYLEKLDGTVCVKSLRDLIESAAIKSAAEEVATEAAWRGKFKSIVLALSKTLELSTDRLFENSFVNAVSGKVVTHSSIPSDDNDAWVTMVGIEDEPEIAWDQAEDYGPGQLRVPFECKSTLTLDFPIFYADAYSQPDHIHVQFGDPDIDKFFNAEAEAVAIVKGFLAITVDDWQAETPDVEYDELTIDEVTEIELQEDEAGSVV